METSDLAESEAGECARCRQQQPSAPDSQTPRRGADSGYSSRAAPDASPSLTPPLLPCALGPSQPPGPSLAAIRSPVFGRTSPPRTLCPPPHRSAGFWRPWVHAPGKEEEEPHLVAEAVSDGSGMTAALGKLSNYRHPVRLFWPKSKCYDYLYQEAEALLKNFPIQATISFYEDSDSEDEIEELICEN
ncbi:PREDICTED: protein ripply2 [Condylura cristata]|uniref:protein ripply2 n=1 Tax=Condylura cristata TaxID=143302 RepID=UPI0003347D50|nr:PREDICTED: protein ripply2 [Condylura cristata]